MFLDPPGSASEKHPNRTWIHLDQFPIDFLSDIHLEGICLVYRFNISWSL